MFLAYTYHDGQNVYEFMHRHQHPPSVDELLIDAIRFLSDIDGEIPLYVQSVKRREQYVAPRLGCVVYYDGKSWESDEERFVDKEDRSELSASAPRGTDKVTGECGQ